MVTGHRDDVLPHGFPALDEAGQYDRADAPPGRTAWDLTSSPGPAAITMPDRARDSILDRHTGRHDPGAADPHSAARHGTGGFPPGWDADTIIAAVLAAARDPDRITRDDPAGWVQAGLRGTPAWRAEASTGPVAITVALDADGQIIDAWPATPPPRRGRDPGPMDSKPRARTGHDDAGPPGTAGPGLPAVVEHLTSICRARSRQGLTADVQVPAPGRYIITISRAGRELTLTVGWRHRRWDITDVQLTVDGEPRDAAGPLHQLIRMLSDHEIGTGTPSRIRGGSPLPRDSALETKKNTVLRV